jgi:hypothetical protein
MNPQRLLILATLLLAFIVIPAQAQFNGVVDKSTCDFIKGWAWDDTQPNTPIKVDIYDTTTAPATRLQTITAQVQREDLVIAGIGNGKHGFIFKTTASIGTGERHRFSVRYHATDTELKQSPQTTPTACYGRLNDTGIQRCSDGASGNLDCPVAGFSGQDSDYGRDAKARLAKLDKTGAGVAGFDFTKIANDGSKLAATAKLGTATKDWACTLDNVTGLLWEVKTNDGGLRDKKNTYTWYNPDETKNGGNAGVRHSGKCIDSKCDTQAYARAVNAATLCGKRDWRIPKQAELLSIVNRGRFNPAIDDTYFPNTVSNYYWSSSPVINNSNIAWTVYFYYGGDSLNTKGYDYFVRLVSTQQ